LFWNSILHSDLHEEGIMPTLLVVDDESSILHAFGRVFRPPEFELLTATTAAEGLALVDGHRPDTVILDINLPDQSELQAYVKLRQIDARVPVLFITGLGTTDQAIEAMKLGAFDFLLKPLAIKTLRELVHKALAISRLMRVPALVAEDETPAATGSDVLVGRCPAMQEVYKAIGRVAPQNVTVLILGESGTGKELVARAIYQHSRRAHAPFLAINCAAIPETLLESELFGHEKGAFTGAERKRIGKFEQCSGGTLFLDEIGDMSSLTQTKVLRVLQDQRFERLGGSEAVQTDVRLIAATNYDLERLVASARFRSDLFYRLSIFTIRLPPLRERGDDLPLLVEHFLRRFNRELGKEVLRVAPQTMEVLRNHAWPGNLRELQSVLKQALLHAAGPILLADFLPPLGQAETKAVGDHVDYHGFIEARLTAGSEDLYAELLTVMERHLLTRVLNHTGGNQLQAARILGITRGSLRTKIRALGIIIERSVSADDEPD
jgi:two-component system nitrogen regulation response regulator GlnG